MRKILKKILLGGILSIFGFSISCFSNQAFAQSTAYDGIIRGSVAGKHLEPNVQDYTIGDELQAKGVNDAVLTIINILIDLLIVLGVIVAMFGGYTIMMSDKPDATKQGITLLSYGIVGILIMVSASFLANSLVGSDVNSSGNQGILTQFFNGASSHQSGARLAKQLFNTIVYPFLKFFLYFGVGILFLMMAVKVFSFITSTDDSAKKQAGGIIAWAAIGIFIMIGAKQIVEGIMGDWTTVENNIESAENSGLTVKAAISPLSFNNIPIVHQIINRALGLTMFVIMILIIIQGYKMIANPTDTKTRESLKKTLLYVIIGVLVIGASYIISNVLIVNNI